MADTIEVISYIDIGDGINHPIDAVTVNGNSFSESTVTGWGFTKNSGTVIGSDLSSDKIILGSGTVNIKASTYGISTTSPSSLSDDTEVPTSKAVYSAINTALASVLTYKGTIGTGGTITSLPAKHEVGDVYVVCSDGTYAGQTCEVGDYIICNTAGSNRNNSHWNIVNGENQVDNKSASLSSAGNSAVLATVDGTDITVTTPASWTGVDKEGTITGVMFNNVSASVSNGIASISVTIPNEVTESTVSGWGFTKNTGTLTSHASGFGQIIVTNTSTGTGAPTGEGSNISASEATEAINFTPSNKWVVLGVEQGWDPGENVLFIGHSLNGTGSGTAGTTSNTSGNSISIPYVNYDAAGHITSVGTRTHTISGGGITTESDPVFSASVAAGITASDISNWNAKTSNTGTLTGVKFNGTDASVSNGIASISVSIPTVNNATLTIQKNGSSVGTFTANASTNTSINIPVNDLPSVTTADNGKCLRVVNGAWTLVSPQTIYTGDGTPSGTLGNDGDVYIQ